MEMVFAPPRGGVDNREVTGSGGNRFSSMICVSPSDHVGPEREMSFSDLPAEPNYFSFLCAA